MDVFYTLDKDDRLIETGGWWDQFAAENDGADAASGKVLGKSLWAFIESAEIRDYLEAVFGSSRDNKAQLCLPYRCDSPARPRLFQMVIDPLPSGGLILRHTAVKRFVPMLTSVSSGAHPHMTDTYCAICHSVPKGDLRIDPANMSGAPDPHEGVPFCPNCASVVAAARA